jgi:hypothetical protein
MIPRPASKGKIDGVGILDGEVWIYEMKSIKAEYYRKLLVPMTKASEAGDAVRVLARERIFSPASSHITELNGHTTVRGVIYLYLNKDNQEMKEFRVEKSFEFLEEALRTAFSCLSHVQAATSA